MWSSARHAVAVLAVCSGLAAATWPGGIGLRAQQAADETIGSAGPMRSVPLLLTDEERHRVYQGLMRFPDVASKDALDLADKVPGSAPLQDLPANVTADIPLVRGVQIHEARGPHPPDRAGEPRRRRNDPALQAAALAAGRSSSSEPLRRITAAYQVERSRPMGAMPMLSPRACWARQELVSSGSGFPR
jgi:hypothetical protein